MKKLIFAVLCGVLSIGMMFNLNTIGANRNMLVEDIPYEWIIVNNNNV